MLLASAALLVVRCVGFVVDVSSGGNVWLAVAAAVAVEMPLCQDPGSVCVDDVQVLLLAELDVRVLVVAVVPVLVVAVSVVVVVVVRDVVLVVSGGMQYS